jgi:DNA repair exonuclease SbcCD ATPase subunit
MPHRTAYIERDARGRERLVIPRSGRAHSHGRKSDRELLNESEEREATLGVEISALQTRLSYAQRDQWQLQQLREEHQRLIHEHSGCRNIHAQLETQVREVRRIEDLLADEQDQSERLQRKIEDLKEKIRLMRRTSGEFEVYRARYEEKSLEVDVLKQRLMERDQQLIDREEQLRLAETRIADRNSTILYFKNYLRSKGFRVEG